MLEFTFIAGMFPKEAATISAALDEASKQGYSLQSTATCQADADNAYYVATMARVAEQQQARSGIGMQGGPRRRPEATQNVDANAPAQSSSPGEH